MNKMEQITSQYLTGAETWLFITTLLYFLMNGAQIFETSVFVPKWTASPPTTFNLLNDKIGVSLKTFWTVFHSLHEITFILAIVFCWKLDPIRNWLILLFIIHFAVRVWTILYFAPNIMEFQKMYELGLNHENLIHRVSLWKMLNYVRVGIFLVVSLGLIPLCVKILNIQPN